MMKTCLMCNETKEESEFYIIKDKRMKNGYRVHSYCKTCKLKADKRWREIHHHEVQSYSEARKKE